MLSSHRRPIIRGRTQKHKLAVQSQKFVGKKVVAGGQEGHGARVDELSGTLVVRFAHGGEKTYHPDFVEIVSV